MATVTLTLADAGAFARGGVLPVMSAYPNGSEKITSSASNTAGTKVAAGEMMAKVHSSGGRVWVNFGVTPVATVAGDDCHSIEDGETQYFGPITEGHSMAVIDDA